MCNFIIQEQPQAHQVQQVMGPATQRSRTFDGNSENYEIWETRFLAYLRGLNLRETILADAPDEKKMKNATPNFEHD